MGRNNLVLMMAVLLYAAMAAPAQDTFGTGANQFTIDFVPISGDAGDLGSWGGGIYYTFHGANRSDYRMGTYEITNDQYAKFVASLGVPVWGDPTSAYNQGPNFPGINVPANRTSWYEAAQFVNWLNTSTGHHAAYKFTGTQGTADYTHASWSTAEAYGGTNTYRHKDAFYFLPSDDEWVKAAYWNGTSLQTDATKAEDTLHQGDGVSGTGWNYMAGGIPATDPSEPWDVGSGSEELNGTFDMVGNVFEWMETDRKPDDYGIGALRSLRGGSYGQDVSDTPPDSRHMGHPYYEYVDIGFRVASVPEPATVSLLALGGLALLRRRARRD